MRRGFLGLLGAVALCLTTSSAFALPLKYNEGTDYVRVNPVQKTTVPAGKVEVLEVFSYGCPACNSFQPVIEELKKGLPANAQMAYLHAAFNERESWPVFQRAFIAAQSLGVAEKAHQAIFDAIWKTGEISIVDQNSGQLKRQQPTINDVAKCYEKLTGVKQAAFLAAANSSATDTKMRLADAQIEQMRVPGTPSIVINGKYRVNLDSIRSVEQLVDMVKFLVAQEASAAKG
jgi:protein dithiol oxidoreductase (disulfide-forming)